MFQNRYRVESTRLPDWNYSSSGWYFVTLCTRDKRCSLGHAVDGQVVLSDAGAIAETEMQSISSHYMNVTIDRYVVMPNHVHAIIVIEGDHAYTPVETGLAPSPASAQGRSLSTIVGSYKAGVSRICHAKGLSDFAWQARFHDHILRSNASLNAVRDYIDHNPQELARRSRQPGHRRLARQNKCRVETGLVPSRTAEKYSVQGVLGQCRGLRRGKPRLYRE
jgi:putative transposase